MIGRPQRPDWREEGPTWPHSEHSRFVDAAGHRWHVQMWGEGPDLLFLHGTGASAHSFAALADALSGEARIVLADLPGHGFTRSPPLRPVSPPNVAADLLALFDKIRVQPMMIVGHSAGAVLALELRERLGRPVPLVAINGAFRPFGGVASNIAPMMAKMLYYNPLTAPCLSASARSEGRVRRLISQTGSEISEEGKALYGRLLKYPSHVSGTLGMMAGWSFDGVDRQVRFGEGPIRLLAGTGDRAVPPEDSRHVAQIAPDAEYIAVQDAGHLLHEEQPERVADEIRRAVAQFAVSESPEKGG